MTESAIEQRVGFSTGRCEPKVAESARPLLGGRAINHIELTPRACQNIERQNYTVRNTPSVISVDPELESCLY